MMDTIYKLLELLGIQNKHIKKTVIFLSLIHTALTSTEAETLRKHIAYKSEYNQWFNSRNEYQKNILNGLSSELRHEKFQEFLKNQLLDAQDRIELLNAAKNYYYDSGTLPEVITIQMLDEMIKYYTI